MLYAEVIGSPIRHSRSPAIHRHWLEALGLPMDYRAREVQEDVLAAYIAEKRADPDWLGCNVTMPLKTAAAGLVDELSADARAIGAVNLILRRHGTLIGHNVDGEGFVDGLGGLAAGWPERRALILGSGGAAAAVARALHQRRFEVWLASRNLAKATALMNRLGIADGHAVPLNEDVAGFECCMLVVNATPLGMEGFPPLEIALDALPPGSIVADIVYHPRETELLRSARTQGLETVDGLAMLIGQAALSFGRLFGRKAPRTEDRSLLSKFAA